MNRDVNVFFGPNGSGKTSLLWIIHSALDNDASILGRTLFRDADVRFHSVFAKTDLVRAFRREEPEELTPSPESDAPKASFLSDDRLSQAVAGIQVRPKSLISKDQCPHERRVGWREDLRNCERTSRVIDNQPGLAYRLLWRDSWSATQPLSIQRRRPRGSSPRAALRYSDTSSR